jgi:hypothetical protein
MSFLRHAEIYRSDVVYKTVESLGRAAASRWSAPGPAEGRSPRTAPCSSSAMSFRAGYSLAGCSPAEPASASPTALSIHCGLSAGNDLSANGNLSLVSVPQHRGAVQESVIGTARMFPGFHSASESRKHAGYTRQLDSYSAWMSPGFISNTAGCGNRLGVG